MPVFNIRVSKGLKSWGHPAQFSIDYCFLIKGDLVLLLCLTKSRFICINVEDNAKTICS